MNPHPRLGVRGRNWSAARVGSGRFDRLQPAHNALIQPIDRPVRRTAYKAHVPPAARNLGADRGAQVFGAGQGGLREERVVGGEEDQRRPNHRVESAA